MVGGIYAQSLYFNNYQYRNAARGVTAQTGQVQAAESAEKTQAAQATGKTGSVVAVSRAANPGVPVEPVDPVPVVTNESSSGIGRMLPFMRQGADPVEMAVRMRIEQYDPAKENEQIAAIGQDEQKSGIESVMKAAEEGECKTCEQRKYQDGSDDPGVSFKTASHIAPEQAASAVRGHEMEHVVRERAEADREDRKVVSQNVNIHTDICPECGKVYVSGGTTTTVTAADAQQKQMEQTGNEQYKPFFAVA